MFPTIFYGLHIRRCGICTPVVAFYGSMALIGNIIHLTDNVRPGFPCGITKS